MSLFLKFKQRVERLWHSRGVVLPLEITPSNAWQHYNNHPERMGMDLLLAAYGSQVIVEELVPQERYAMQRATLGKRRGDLYTTRDWALCFLESRFDMKNSCTLSV